MWHNQIAVWKDQVTCSLVSAATRPSKVASVGWPWGSWTPCSDHGHHFLDTLNLVKTQYPQCLLYLPSPPDLSLTSSFLHSTTWANLPTFFLPQSLPQSCLPVPRLSVKSSVLWGHIFQCGHFKLVFFYFFHPHVSQVQKVGWISSFCTNTISMCLLPIPSVQTLILQNINHLALRLSSFLLSHLPSFR